MGDFEIKEIVTFTEGDTSKTKMIILEDSQCKEIVFEGTGSIKVAVEA